MTRPLLLPDIDGVLNPYGASAWIAAASGVLDIAWASSWNDDANRLLVPLLHITPLLTPLPVVTMPPRPFDPSQKVPLIAAYARQRSTAWIDDIHPPHSRNRAANRTAPTLPITADPAIGLTREAIYDVIVWAAAL